MGRGASEAVAEGDALVGDSQRGAPLGRAQLLHQLALEEAGLEVLSVLRQQAHAGAAHLGRSLAHDLALAVADEPLDEDEAAHLGRRGGAGGGGGVAGGQRRREARRRPLRTSSAVRSSRAKDAPSAPSMASHASPSSERCQR